MSPFEDLLKQIDAAKAQLDSMRPLDREREERAMQKLRFWWTYHSNAIEGNSLTQGETEMFLMEGLTAKGKPLKDHLDIRGHSHAIDYLREFVRDEQMLTEATIRKLHEILLGEPYRVDAITASGGPTTKLVAIGQYKTQPNHVRTPTGEIHYYATPEETPAKMGDLMNWYRDSVTEGSMHCVEIAARYHHRFTAIHPFDDGNGRMSRLLMNLLLMQVGYPPVVIRLSERDQYLAALRRADAGEYDDFLAFIAEHVLSALSLYLRAAQGEEIHEPTDVEREIALLKMELKHFEEPQAFTQEGQIKIFESSLDPLFAEIARLLSPLCELFAANQMAFRSFKDDPSGQPGIIFPGAVLIVGARAFPRDEHWWTGQWDFDYVELQFELKGFKKGGLNTFDLYADMYISFEPLKWVVGLEHPSFSVQHFYQEQLTRAEITEIAQKLTRYFLDEIKRRTDVLS